MKITIIYNNCEVVRDEEVSEDSNIINLMAHFEEIITKADIRPDKDKDQVTVWVGDTHMYIAYSREINGYYDVAIIKNYDTFSFIVNETGLFSEDMDGNLHQIKTIGEITKLMGIIV